MEMGNIIIAIISLGVVTVGVSIPYFIWRYPKNEKPKKGKILTKREPQINYWSGREQDSGHGYKFYEHYNIPEDPTISYINVSVINSTNCHKLKDLIEERYYVLSGEAEIILYDENVDDDATIYTLKVGDSLLVPDSYWRKIVNKKSETLKLMAICMPRWRKNAFVKCTDETIKQKMNKQTKNNT